MSELNYLIEKAERVLKSNRRDGFTIPRAELYPFQWNWDSGFVALGLAHTDIKWAIEELQSLLRGQWENGMIPHILFHSENETTYFPNWDFWEAKVNSGSPVELKTSGITQPPVLGFIVEMLWRRYPDNEALKNFIKSNFKKLINHHRFFYKFRDPLKEGLFFTYHPWESGRDNSPIWDPSMSRIEIDKNTLPPYTRRDTSIADPSERPTEDKYDRYVYLLELGKKYRYDQLGIYEESPLLVQDVMMNAILIKSNQALINLGRELCVDVGELSEWQQQSTEVFDARFWNNELQFYCSYDLRTASHIKMKEIGGYIPLFAQIPSTQKSALLIKRLSELHEMGLYLCPSFDIDEPLFDSKRYWRGPVWPQMNWMIYHGLKLYNQKRLADIVKNDLIELVQKLGFYEYFEPQKNKAADLNKGYGGDQFSWTASSILDLIKT